MSTHVVVIGSDLRRATIKVTPGTYLIDVLHEACKKLSLSSDKYLLKNKQKTVDLTVPFRASGLVGGAKLELVQKSKTPSAVQVGLQLPHPEAKEVPGGRLIRKFPSDLTLWGVLRQFESSDSGNNNVNVNINITARGVAKTSTGTATGSGQLYYETPVLNIMGRDYATFADFQKTLAQLGYNSGSVLLRLMFRTTDKTLVEAMEEISRSFKEVEEDGASGLQPQAAAEADVSTAVAAEAVTAEATTAEATTAEEMISTQVADTPMADAPDTAEQATEQAAEEEADEGEEKIAETNSETKDPHDPVAIFLAPSTGTPAAASAPTHEDDFTPTIAHAKLHQSQLQQRARNRRLPSDRELADAQTGERARLDAVRSVLIKVRFPDNTSGDWRIDDRDATGAFLYAAVRRVMADPTLPFRLVLPPGGGTAAAVLADATGPAHTLIAGYRLRGRVLVNLVWDDAVPVARRALPFLRADVVAAQGQAIRIPEMTSGGDKDGGDGKSASGKSAAAASAAEEEDGEEQRRPGKKGTGKVPKWLKLGKK